MSAPGGGPPPDVAPADSVPGGGSRRAGFAATTLMFGVTLLPVATAAWRAAGEATFPTADHAHLALRALDVGTAHQPLLGAWPSAAFGRPLSGTFNHLGPLHAVLLAPWVRLLGPARGLVTGAAAINVLAVVGIGWVALRHGGRRTALVALAVTSVFTWGLGDAILTDAWEPYQVMLPALAACFLAWGVSRGDLWLVPPLVLAASVVIQTHLSYVYATGIPSGLAVAWGLRARRRATSASAGRSMAAPLLSGAATAIVAWLPPLVEELGPGRGNLTRVWTAFMDQRSLPTVGPARALRMVAAVVALPPAWWRPSLAETFVAGPGESSGLGFGFGGLPSTLRSWVALGLVGTGLVAGAVAARRQRRAGDDPPPSAAGFALVCLGAALLGTARLPIGEPFGLAGHMVRFLWPVGAFSAFALLAALAARDRRGRVTTAGAASVLAVAVAANLPAAPGGPHVPRHADRLAAPTFRDALRTLHAHTPPAPYLIERLGGLRDPFGPALVLDLRRRGGSVFVNDPFAARTFGPRRVWDGRAVRAVIGYRWGVTGPGSLAPPPGTRLLFRRAGLTPEDRARLRRAEDGLVAHLRQHGLRLRVPARLVRVLLPGLPPGDSRRFPGLPAGVARRLVRTSAFGMCVRLKTCELAPGGRRWAQRVADLRDRHRAARLVVWMAPAPRPAHSIGAR